MTDNQDPFSSEALRRPEEGDQGDQGGQPTDLASIARQSQQDAQRAADDLAEQREADRGKAATHGRSALQAEQQAAQERAELAASFRAGHITADTLSAHTEEVASKASSTEEFYAQLAASDPDAIVAGGAERGGVAGGLRKQSAYGSGIGEVQDITDPHDVHPDL